MSETCYIDLILDAKNNPPQYIFIINSDNDSVITTITQIPPPIKKRTNIEKTLVEASIVELEKLKNKYKISCLVVYYTDKNLVRLSYSAFKLYINYKYAPNALELWKEKKDYTSTSKENKTNTTEIILFHL